MPDYKPRKHQLDFAKLRNSPVINAETVPKNKNERHETRGKYDVSEDGRREFSSSKVLWPAR